MNTAEHEIIETELERVERWRTAELMRVDFAGDDAIALAARTDVDLHQAIELVQRGLPARARRPHPRLT
jgi:hypothetical protein